MLDPRATPTSRNHPQMHITAEPGESHVILHLRGEFDTYYCHLLEEEIAAVQKSSIQRVVLNLRLVKFINSTALGAIIKASKTLTKAGGMLVISRPSAFCRDIIEKVGLNRVVPVADNDEEAITMLTEKAKPAASADGPSEEDPSSVIFRMADMARLRHFVEQTKSKNPLHGHAFGDKWAGIGRMSGLDEDGLRFTWSGGKTDLSAFDMGQMLSVGTELFVKFRLPLLQRGYVEAKVTVSLLEERSDGVKVGAQFAEIDDETRTAVGQYAQDMAFLKEELRKATDQ
ncbi:MAG: anti-anti-sigma factor [Planctomycetota bacterium]